MYQVYLFCAGGIDHVRVHPKFLHSNATSHQWVLGGTCFVYYLEGFKCCAVICIQRWYKVKVELMFLGCLGEVEGGRP